MSFFSSQVLFLICRKLIGQQMVNGTEVLKWLREILICRNKFLLKNKVGFCFSTVTTDCSASYKENQLEDKENDIEADNVTTTDTVSLWASKWYG